MSPLAKVFVVVNLILSVTFFGAAATLFSTRHNWREYALKYKNDSDEALKKLKVEMDKLGQRIVEVNSDRVKLRTDYNSVSADNNKIQNELGAAKTQIAKQESRIDTEVKEKTGLTSRLQDLEKKHADTLALLETVRKEADEAKGTKEKAVDEMTRIRLDLDKVNEEQQKTLIEFNTLKEKAETMQLQIAAAVKAKGPDVINLDALTPPIDAIVQAVKAEDKLVVLSVGKDQKVQEGFKFTIYRGDKFIGKVKVIKVWDDLAGAQILYTNESESVQVGDKAATQI